MAFPNDAVTATEDRNLIVDWIAIRAVGSQPAAVAAVPTLVSNGSVSRDGTPWTSPTAFH
ncbi:MAG: hypothetical protein ACYDBQ_05080 [Thermoplasmatota archaeon]